LLGHTQPGTTARYAHLFDDPLRAATERVGAIVTGAAAAWRRGGAAAQGRLTLARHQPLPPEAVKIIERCITPLRAEFGDARVRANILLMFKEKKSRVGRPRVDAQAEVLEMAWLMVTRRAPKRWTTAARYVASNHQRATDEGLVRRYHTKFRAGMAAGISDRKLAAIYVLDALVLHRVFPPPRATR
jgi:hypothetical protein